MIPCATLCDFTDYDVTSYIVKYFREVHIITPYKETIVPLLVATLINLRWSHLLSVRSCVWTSLYKLELKVEQLLRLRALIDKIDFMKSSRYKDHWNFMQLVEKPTPECHPSNQRKGRLKNRLQKLNLQLFDLNVHSLTSLDTAYFAPKRLVVVKKTWSQA